MHNNRKKWPRGKNENKSKIYAEKPKDDNPGQKNCQNRIKKKQRNEKA